MTRIDATDFDTLAKNAISISATFVLRIFEDGKWSDDDQFSTLEDAADAYVNGFEDWGDNQRVFEVWADGNQFDVTSEAREAVEGWCHERFDSAPWEVAA